MSTFRQKGFAVLLLATIASWSSEVIAQSSSGFDGAVSWFKDNKVSIRKTFETTKDTDSPAAIFWAEDSGRGTPSATYADVAVKASPWEPFPNASQVFTLSPIIEWHRGVSGEKKVTNNLSGALRADWIPFDVDDETGSGGFALAPAFVLSEVYKRDLKANGWEDRTELIVSLFGLRRGLPGYLWLHTGDDSTQVRPLLFTYATEFGGELIHRAEKVGGGEISTLLAKVSLNYWPIGDTLQWRTEGIYRYVLHDPEDRDRLWDVTSSINYFPFANPALGLGLDFSRGHDSYDSFRFREKLAVALKVKFGE